MDDITNDLILNRAAQYRGWIINGTVCIERLIDVYLSCHFAFKEAQRQELLDLVFASSPGIPFDIKRALFITILKKHNQPFHDSNKKLFEDIAYIGKRRNIIAHYLLDRDAEAERIFKTTGKIGFVKFKEVTETVYFSALDIKDLTDKIESAISIISTLMPKKYEITRS